MTYVPLRICMTNRMQLGLKWNLFLKSFFPCGLIFYLVNHVYISYLDNNFNRGFKAVS